MQALEANFLNKCFLLVINTNIIILEESGISMVQKDFHKMDKWISKSTTKKLQNINMD